MEKTSSEAGFEWALAQLRNGNKVYRKGWNGKGMWLKAVFGEQGKGGPMWPGGSRYHCAYTGMKTAQNEFVPWNPSYPDLFKLDWELFGGE